MSSESLQDYFATKEGKRLSQGLIRSLYEAAISDGSIDPRGKTRQQIEVELIRHATAVVAGKAEIRFTIDHRQTLLREARRYTQERMFEYACLMYATWIEHWCNSTLLTLGKRKKMSEKEVTDIIRAANLPSKLSWVWKLMGAPRLFPAHVKSITSISEARNSFVHYKWLSDERNSDKQERLAQSAEKVITYLRSYERKHVYFNRKVYKSSAAS